MFRMMQPAIRMMPSTAGRSSQFCSSSLILGVRDSSRVQYWKMIARTLVHYPKYIGIAVQLAVQGFHLRKVTEKVRELKIDDYLRKLQLETGQPA